MAVDSGDNFMNIENKTKICAKKIQNRLRLLNTPEITLISRSFEKKPDGWCFGTKPNQFVTNVKESVLNWSDLFEGEIIYPFQDLYFYYPEVFQEANKNVEFEPILTEILVQLGAIRVSAGFNCMILGQLTDNSRFMVVKHLSIRELFNNCGLASLIKLDEIKIAETHKCTFIHTWHEYDNPNLISAMVPSLKNGFILYQKIGSKGIGYDGDGSIHLRKYFNNDFISEVLIEGQKEPVVSPEQNDFIIKALLATSRRHKGKIFKNIMIKRKI
jgi:hypothetical protein